MSIRQHRMILLEALIGKDLYTYCKERIGEDEANVLKGILKKEVEEWFNSEDVKFRREGRAATEFAEALILDKVVLHWLKDYFEKEHGVELALNGCDKIDTLLNNNVTCDPDFKIEGKEIYIEEITCYTGMVRTTGALHLRQSKGDTLKRLAKDKMVYILIFDVPARSYTFVQIKEDTKMYGMDEIEKFGGKSGYGMDVGNAKFREMKQANLPIQQISNIPL